MITSLYLSRYVGRTLSGDDVERFFREYQDFATARRRLIARLAELPLVEAPWRRRVLTHVVSMRGRLLRRSDITVPFGWATEKIESRPAVEIGPAWFILPRRWYRELRWNFYDYAIKYGAAEAPYDGCLYSELRWFPAQRLDA